MEIIHLALIQYSSVWKHSALYPVQQPNPFPPIDVLPLQISPSLEMALQTRSYFNEAPTTINVDSGKHTRLVRTNPFGVVTVKDTIRYRGWTITATFQNRE